ncbi:RNA polymerase II holoenzyme cyclin-like subunit [Blastomyces dermatitidis ER-3]|uniref:RNA polymerase II holoenzyme cyclin-like subunit n=4 Tax=Ajellomyces dermatitidis TaxID=5039 RepID=F2TGA0_AJEDA|nr:RNA polymerase II holoenzyme cyclin-like subunit [Blastomyces dermatitidis ER-3]EEQ91041.1 RNA polymerase II holoenzyme cyclin-like subunit [Blastomyces dermatitidis ER-3]EGE82263.2 RNA polymerase II holoenzyme cyclin-like subunit [Blastomyces dermatitidis ATCC 18188]
MAANYWVSTQRRHWLFERDQLAEIRRGLDEGEKQKQLLQQFPLPDLRYFSIYINLQLVRLGKRMTTRQQALATAQVYIRRFYTKVEIRRTNPYLVLTTAFYLACKMEECPQHIRFVVSEAKGLWPDFIVSDISKLGECEFWLISEMNSQLIVHHPYRTLSELQSTLSLTSDEVSLAWSVINDHYLTDLPLLQPPHVIAVTAILIAVVCKTSPASSAHLAGASPVSATLRDGAGALAALGDKNLPPRIQKLVDWLSTGEVSIEAVIECTQELVSLYEAWVQYSEKACREQIGRYVKARSLDK